MILLSETIDGVVSWEGTARATSLALQSLLEHQ